MSEKKDCPLSLIPLQEIVDRFNVPERTAYRDPAELARMDPVVRDDYG